MSCEELGEVLHLKESYIRSHWQRILKVYEKQDIKLYKRGRGETAIYGVQFPWMPEDEIVWDVDSLDIIL